MKFTLTEAKEYFKLGKIEEWLHVFLRTEGNNHSLSEGIKAQKRYWVLKEMSLQKLVVTSGPDHSFDYPVEKDRWERVTQEMASSIQEGWDLPPPLIEFNQGKYYIRDGNNRCQALKLLEKSSYFVLVWYNSKKELSKDNTMQGKLFFVTGTSGSGKSTIEASLQKRFPKFTVKDFDSVGVPEGADENWRKKTTDYWVKEARKDIEKGTSVIIVGQIVPSEVLAAKSYDSSITVYFGFIKVSEEQTRNRLQKRGWDHQLIENNVNWAKHLEKDTLEQEQHCVVDATNKNPDEVAHEFSRWIDLQNP